MNVIYVAKRGKNNKITLFCTQAVIDNSYTCLCLTQDEFMHFLDLTDWQVMFDGAYGADAIYTASFNGAVKEYFYNLAKIKVGGTPVNYAKRINSNVAGTSCLVRSQDKTRIWIAQRKAGNSQNITSINRVCIDDATRGSFFRDVNSIYRGATYTLSINDRYFSYWNTFMNEEFIRQANDASKSKTT
jgi:hypothetical protein